MQKYAVVILSILVLYALYKISIFYVSQNFWSFNKRLVKNVRLLYVLIASVFLSSSEITTGVDNIYEATELWRKHFREYIKMKDNLGSISEILKNNPKKIDIPISDCLDVSKEDTILYSAWYYCVDPSTSFII